MQGSYMITLAGVVSDENFHKCWTCIKSLEADYGGFVKGDIQQFFSTQWTQYLTKIQNEKKGLFYQHKGSPLVFVNGSTYIGGVEQFMEWALQTFKYTDKTSILIYRKTAGDAMRNAITNTPGRSYVHMSLTMEGLSEPQKVIIELFDEYCPKTCENFKALCCGHQKMDTETGQPLTEKMSYVNTEIHRVVKGMYVQGGDLSKVFAKTKHGYSKYGGEFADESFHVKHSEPGLLGMCKRGGVADSNECQFYVTLGSPLTFMDGQTVVFGRVVEGFRVFKLIEQLDLVNEKPAQSVRVAAAGIHELKKKTLAPRKR